MSGTELDTDLEWVIEHTNDLAAFARQGLAEGLSIDAVLTDLAEAVDSDHDRLSVFAAVLVYMIATDRASALRGDPGESQ